MPITFEAMPVVARYPGQLGFLPRENYLVELLRLIVLCTQLQGASEHEEVVNLASQVHMPSPDDAWVAHRQIGLNHPVVAEDVIPVSPHDFCEETPLVEAPLQRLQFDALKHFNPSYLNVRPLPEDEAPPPRLNSV